MNAQAVLHLSPMCDKSGCWNRTEHKGTDDHGHVLRACNIEHHDWLIEFRRKIYAEYAPKEA